MRRDLPIAAVLATLLLAAPSAAGAVGPALPAGASVLAESPAGITIEYAPPRPGFESTADPAGGVRVTAPNHAPGVVGGGPDLPIGWLRFGAPAGGEVRLVIESASYLPLGRVDVAPVPEVVGSFEQFREAFVRDPAAYGVRGAPGLAPAELAEGGVIEGVRTLSLVLRPARWNPATGELEWLERARIRLAFPPAPAAAASSPEMASRAGRLDALIVNPATARSLRTVRAAAKRGVGDSFASSSTWLRMEVETKGVYRLTYDNLVAAGIANPTTAIGSPATLRLYNGGGLPIPDLPDSSSASPSARPTWMRQIPILVQDDGNGQFNPGDEIVFYALGLDGFLSEFDPALPDDEHYHSRFADKNVYWLTWGGEFSEPPARLTPGISAPVVPGSGARTAAHFPFRTHEERDVVEDLSRYGEDGYFWTDFSTGAEKVFTSSSPGAVVTEPATLALRLYGHREGDVRGGLYQGTAIWNGVALGDTNFLWDDHPVTGVKYPFDFRYTGMIATGRGDTLRVRLLPSTALQTSQEVYMTWFELAYRRRYDAAGAKSFLFASPDSSGRILYHVSGFGGTAPLVIDVTDPFGARLVTGVSVAGGVVSFEREESEPRRYALADQTALLTPGAIRTFPVSDLRAPTNRADYLILVADELFSGVGRLRDHRRSAAGGGYTVQIVPLSQIAAQFGWGITEPAAVRDFLAWAVDHWDDGKGQADGIVPRTVVIVGDATKDYRGLRRSTNRNLFPLFYRVPRDGSAINTFGTDDYYAYLHKDGVVELALGRLPASGASDLTTLIDKIIQYEADPEFGDWRSRLLFVADDEMKGCSSRELSSICFDTYFLGDHTADVESAAVSVSSQFDRVKVYMVEYPFGNQSEKPAAKQAYIDELSRGALVSHYSGHGGFDKLADENIFFASDADATRLGNGRRLYIFSAFSCSVGTFDLSDQSSIAELLLRTRGGGAIASIASDAPAFAGSSRILGVNVVRDLYKPPGAERLTLGEAIFVAKSAPELARDRQNDEKYNLLGDPALQVGIPKLPVTIDSRPAFMSGTLDSVSGSVLEGGEVATGYDGIASVLVSGVADTSGYSFYSPRLQDSTLARVQYSLPGGALYRGDVAVVNGRWKARFFVPTDIRQGPLARVRAYVSGGGSDGLGSRDSLPAVRAAEPSPDVAGDLQGPAITVSVDGKPYRAGMSVVLASTITVRASDPHGIDVQGEDDFFSLAITADAETESEKRTEISDRFRYDFGSFRDGQLSVPLSLLLPSSPTTGLHELTLQASDNVSNRSKSVLLVELVAEAQDLAVQRALNFPNPFSDRTEIQYDLSQSADRVRVRIFTVNGRLIREFAEAPAALGNNTLVWDGRDQDGDTVANGVYFFKVAAEAEGVEAEAIGKAVVMKD